MNLALPALAILLGLLPGICCFYGYFAGRFDKRSAGVSAAEELSLYVVYAIPIDAFSLLAYRKLGLTFDFSVATHLLAGSIAEAVVHSEIATFLDRNLAWCAWTYLVVLAGSFILGSVGRRIVWASRLDTRIPYLRVRHNWFYILQGREKNRSRDVVSFVDVLTKLPDADGSQTRLFRGVVSDFELSPAGAIEALTLLHARRGKGRGKDFEWREIPSDRFLILGKDIHSINLTYVVIEAQDDPVSAWRRWWRSFCFEEP